MNNPFVPFEIATKLKQLGFNGPCFGFYVSKGEYRKNFNFKEDRDKFLSDKQLKNSDIHVLDFVTAPLYQDVCWWLLENYHCRVKFDYDYLMDVAIDNFLEKIKITKL